MNVTTRLSLSVVLTLFLFTSIGRAEAPTAAATPETPLTEQRTATELPTKRKLPTAKAVEVKRQESDQQIQTRLTRIAESQDVFKKVKVKVVEGIVTLQGEVEEESYAKSFSALSERIEGVIGVVDQMKSTDIKKTGLRLAQSEVNDLMQKFFKFLPYLASCLVIMFITLLIGLAVFRFARMVLQRRMPNRPMMAQSFAKIITAPVFFFGIYLILQVGGATGLAATIVGGTGMLGIIIGLAGKNIIENVLSSFMLTLRNPFKVGDQVIIGTESGVVHKVDSRCTMLLNADGVFTQIPNTTVLAAVIKNITAHPVNRVLFTFPVSLEEELPHIEEAFEKTVELNRKLILNDPKPKMIVTEITATTATLEVTFWVDSQKVNSGHVKSNLLQTMRYAIDEAKTDKATESLIRRKHALDSGIQRAEQTLSEKHIIEKQTHEIQMPSN